MNSEHTYHTTRKLREISEQREIKVKEFAEKHQTRYWIKEMFLGRKLADYLISRKI